MGLWPEHFFEYRSMSDVNSLVGLAALEARLQQDLAWLDLPAKPW
ncbi:hypothetical protein ALO37_102592, partial [Pseudomonas savastanoi pv. glycinea]